MVGFTRIPGISEQDLRRRFPAWELHNSAEVPVDEMMRHTRIPLPLRAAMRSGRLRILRFELSRVGTRHPSDESPRG
jgi:hypothetical protein